MLSIQLGLRLFRLRTNIESNKDKTKISKNLEKIENSDPPFFTENRDDDTFIGAQIGRKPSPDAIDGTGEVPRDQGNAAHFESASQDTQKKK